MENTTYTEMKIDQQASAYLMSAAKWNMFLSILGFVCCGFMLLGGIMFMLLGGVLNRFMEDSPIGGFTFGLIYLIFAAIYFFPCYFLYLFSSKMQHALNRGDQESLNGAFSNFKAYSKYTGIVVIVCIGLSILACILIPIFAMASGF